MTRTYLTLLFTAFLSLAGCICSRAGTSGDFSGGDGSIPAASAGGPLADINFDFDSSAITPTAQGILQSNAAWMKANSVSLVTVEGHCDERGTNEYNLALGEQRAMATRSFLVNLGVRADQMSVVSYGEETPLNPARNEQAYAQNRRVHFRIQ